MKNKIVSAIVSLVVLAAVVLFLRPSVGSNVSIAINGKEYIPCALTVQEFMENGYSLATMTVIDGQMSFTDYRSASLDAKTEYKMAISLRPKGTEGANIDAWLYNPKSQPVTIYEGRIRGYSCHVAELKQEGVTVAVKGFTIDGQSKQEIAAWAEEALTGYQKYESEDVNALSYKKSGGSYTFNFGKDDIVTKAIVLQSV